MRIKYEDAPDIKRKIDLIINILDMGHLNKDRIFCLRSHGSKSRGIIARCHSLPKVMQLSLGAEPAYIIEVISKNFDKQSEEEKLKTLIHELLHIPKSFGGGFRHHNVITKARIKRLFSRYKKSIDGE
ncbi:MAG: metallopeptidase [Candidatus Pacearchaeota archaeon]|nr:MAG: metallopeptidase [Candidatus Pacearchaeota archaeon]